MSEQKEAFNIDRNGDICRLIRKIASKNYRIGEEVYRDIEEVMQLIESYTTRKELEARLDEMYALKSYSVPMYGIVMGRSSENYEWRITQLSTGLTNKEMK